MRVYRISTLAKPPQSRFPYYSLLVAEDKVWKFIHHGGPFKGMPFNRWKRQDFFIEKPLVPKPNFFGIGPTAFVCDEKARELAGEPLEMSGEFLSIRVEGEPGKYWIYNVTNCINVVDIKSSKWRRFGPGASGRIMEQPAFFASRFGEEVIFKIPEDRATLMYCAERTSDPEDGEFKALVERHGLTGLEFELVWSDEKVNSTRSPKHR